ncbi:Cuticle protein [Homarus americanus]|uniref:Cuticle protein n=1 Tax=Homarus americanus TaxID=6706 RepID=A0A8J5NCF5_HOMAM|nr:Cuticle protein [Homarus americanus]
MRTVVLAVVGVCSAFPFIPDNPDVAAEKARFFQAFKAAEAAALPSIPIPRLSPSGRVSSCLIPSACDGTPHPVSDTRDVAAARNTFFNTYRSQVAATLGAAPRPHGGAVQYQAAPSYRPAPSYQPKWTGPLASNIPAGLPGSTNQVADTPEVAAAKHSFYNTYQRQAAAAAAPSRYY